MCSFDQARKLSCWYECNVARAAPPHNDHFLPIHNLIQDACQVFPQARVCGFNGHPLLLYRNPVQKGWVDVQ
jgi:hypothetical protein